MSDYEFKKKIQEATGANRVGVVIENLSKEEKVALVQRLSQETKKRTAKYLSLRKAALLAGVSLFTAKLYNKQGKLNKYRIPREESGTKHIKYKPSIVPFLREERDRGIARRGNYKRGSFRRLGYEQQKKVKEQQEEAAKLTKELVEEDDG